MAVYVDDSKANYRGMKMCHLIADNRNELLDMADAIGVERRHIQFSGYPKEHFDICKSKRALAVKLGAIEVDSKYIVRLIKKKRAMSLSIIV